MPGPIDRLLQQHEAWDTQMDEANEHASLEQSTLAEVARGLNATVRLVQALHHEVKEFAIGQATLRVTITSMEETMRELRKAITATDPASLTIRVVVLERELENMKEWKKEQEVKLRMVEQERERAGWQWKIAVAGSLFSCLLSIIAAAIVATVKR
jgi:predicted  nucleic acid-binding Zn-ribbon protein